MEMDYEFWLSYVILNAFEAYIIYCFMNAFLVKVRWSKKIVAVSFCVYFLVIGSIYLTFELPPVTLLANVLLFFLLTFNFEANWRQRLITVGLILAVLLSAEVLSIGLVAIVKAVYYTDYTSIEYTLAKIGEQTIVMLFYKIYTMVGATKLDKAITISNWIIVSLMPIVIIVPSYILVGIFLPLSVNRYQRIALYVCIGFIFLFNIIMYFVYDKFNQFTHELYENEIKLQRTMVLKKEIEYQKQSNERIGILKHDMKQHLTALKQLAKRQEYDELNSYINSIANFFDEGNVNTIKTACPYLNDIVNYKIYEANQQDLSFVCDTNVNREIEITLFDMNMLLGNLLDNAIEATLRTNKDKTIYLSIKLEKNLLYIVIENPYDEKYIKSINGVLKSVKTNALEHGYGLKSVKRVIKKYNGEFSIIQSEGRFKVKLMMYA